MKKVAINGLGRIGRAAFKILIDDPNLQLVAINDLVSPYQLAYLLNFDSIYGKLETRIYHDEYNLYVNGKQIRVLNTQDPAQLPWREMGIDVVFECTGKNTRREDLEKHIYAGANYVILSALSNSEDITTIVNGVNAFEGEQKIISCASSTTNCTAPILEIMGRRLGIKKTMLTSIRAYTGSSSVLDGACAEIRYGRASASNLIPGSTSATIATPKVLPQYQYKFGGISIQGPVAAGSIADITFLTERPTSVEEVNSIFQQESGSDRYAGIVAVNFDPIVSSDILKDSRASVVDLTMTQVVDGDLVKVMSWYDNEWGFANQMVREAKRITKFEMVLA